MLCATPSELRNPEISRLYHSPLWLITELGETFQKFASIVREFFGRQALHVFKQDCARAGTLNQCQRRRKHVALVFASELFSSDAKRRAGYSCRKQIQAGEVLWSKIANVLLDDIPMRSVRAEGSAELGFVFDSGRMMKARHFQSKGLTATSGTQFERSKIHSVGGAERIVRRGSSADICCGRNNARRHRDTTTSAGR